jgi:hypothetical protein
MWELISSSDCLVFQVGQVSTKKVVELRERVNVREGFALSALNTWFVPFLFHPCMLDIDSQFYLMQC